MARPKMTAPRLTLEDFRRLGVRPHEFRSFVIRQAAVRKTRDLAKQQLASPSDQVGLQLARVATTTYRLLDPRLRDESAHSAYVGRILPQALSWASQTSFSREPSQFGSVPRESGLSAFEHSSRSDAELIEMLDLNSPPPSRRTRSESVNASDWTTSLSDADLLRPRRLKKWHLRALGWFVATAACFAFGVAGAAVYRWLDVGREIARQENTIVQLAVPSVGLAHEGQSLQPLAPLASIHVEGAPASLDAPVLDEAVQELLSDDGQVSGQAVAEGASKEDPKVVASVDPVLEAGSESIGFPFPDLGDSKKGLPFLEDLPENWIPGLAADPGIARPSIVVPATEDVTTEEGAAEDGATEEGATEDGAYVEAADDERADLVADQRPEDEFGGEIREAEPSDDSLWLARLELLRWMPHLDVPYEAKNAHLRILELELAGRKFQRSPAGYWVVQTLIAEAAWLVENLDEVERRLGVLTTRYRVSPGKLLADTFVGASVVASHHAAVPGTRDHLFQNGLRLCDKLLVSSEPECCKSVLEALDSLLPSEPDEAERSIGYLRDYLSAADEMIRYEMIRYAEGAEVLSDQSPMGQGESMGRYHCLLRRDWEKGLPGLVDSSDILIARAAQDELAMAGKDEATEFKTVAQQWLVAASEATGRPADSMRLHAIDLLRRAREGAQGLLASEIDRRIDELIEDLPGHLLPDDGWGSSRDLDPNSRRNRRARRTAPVRSGQAL